jgi:hypothetical protein
LEINTWVPSVAPYMLSKPHHCLKSFMTFYSWSPSCQEINLLKANSWKIRATIIGLLNCEQTTTYEKNTMCKLINNTRDMDFNKYGSSIFHIWLHENCLQFLKNYEGGRFQHLEIFHSLINYISYEQECWKSSCSSWFHLIA